MVLPWVVWLAAAMAWTGARQTAVRASVPCTMEPDNVHAVIVVERDTLRTLPRDPGIRFTSATRTSRMSDSLVLRADERTAAARVRLVRMDSLTRNFFVRRGVVAAEPQAVIVAAEHDASCRFLRYRDTVSWTRVGDRGYIAGTLALDTTGLPVIVVSSPRAAPYPRQRALAVNARAADTLATPDAVFEFEAITAARSQAAFAPMRAQTPRSARQFALHPPLRAWYARHTTDAEREPLRTWMRDEVLLPRASLYDRARTRLRGTFVVTVRSGADTMQWTARTFEHVAGPWEERDSVRSTADLMRRPWASGHRVDVMLAPRISDLPQYLVGHSGNGDGSLTFTLADPPEASDTARTSPVDGELRLRLRPLRSTMRTALLRFRSAQDEESLRWAAAGDTVPVEAWRTVHIPLTFRFGRRDGVLVDQRLGDVAVRIVRLDTIGIRPQPR